MIKLSKKEIEYVKKDFTDFYEIMKSATTEKLLGYIRDFGDSLKDIMMFNEAEYLYENINTNEFANEKIIRAFANINAFWVWIDDGYESADELYEITKNKNICSIYEKYLELIKNN